MPTPSSQMDASCSIQFLASSLPSLASLAARIITATTSGFKSQSLCTFTALSFPKSTTSPAPHRTGCRTSHAAFSRAISTVCIHSSERCIQTCLLCYHCFSPYPIVVKAVTCLPSRFLAPITHLAPFRYRVAAGYMSSVGRFTHSHKSPSSDTHK